jgi:DNA polymerase III delta prime subunit
MSKKNELITQQQLDQLKSYAWTLKYRPCTLDEVILPESILAPIKKMVRVDKKIPHLLFTSVLPGSGKSTLSKCIINELGADAMAINASKDNGIDVIRSKVIPFAERHSIFDDAPKVVWLDEFDGTTEAFQNAFRMPLEEYDQSCSMIMTANHITKISEPIQDRCQTFDFNLTNKLVKKELIVKIIKRVMMILDAEGVTYDGDTLMVYCNKEYPRFRNIITGIQQYVAKNGNILDKGILESTGINTGIYDMIAAGKFTPVKKEIFSSSFNIDALYRGLFDNLLKKFEGNNAVYAPMLITINQYMVQHSTVIDKEINAVALVMELIGIIQGG